MQSLQSIKIEGNPMLAVPSDILSDHKQLMNYATQSANTTVRWNRVSLLVLGKEVKPVRFFKLGFFVKNLVCKKGVGKSNLIEMLRNNRTKSKNISTDGVEIFSWNVESAEVKRRAMVMKSPLERKRSSTDGESKKYADTKFTIFDFGGQSLFYMTHQFFLHKEGIYIVAFNLSCIDYKNIFYWINTIVAVCGTEPPISVILVGTHLDLFLHSIPSKHQSEVLSNLKLEIRKKCKSYLYKLEDICLISNHSGEGISDLRKKLLQIVKDKSLNCKIVPKHYEVMANAIHKLRHKEVISWSEYCKVALEVSIPFVDLGKLTKFLHDSGLIMHFDEEKLRELVVVDPQFLAKRMSDIVSFKYNWEDGIVLRSLLNVVWKEYTEQRKNQIIFLLERFEVLFSTILKDSNASVEKEKSLEQSLFIDDEESNEIKKGIEKKSGTKDGMVGREELERASQAFAQVIVIPNMLPLSVGREKLSSLWTNVPFSHKHYRKYSFTFLPEGFFSRVIVRSMNAPELRILHIWRLGMIVEQGEEQRALLQLLDCNLYICVGTKKKTEKKEKGGTKSGSRHGQVPVLNSLHSIDKGESNVPHTCRSFGKNEEAFSSLIELETEEIAEAILSPGEKEKRLSRRSRSKSLSNKTEKPKECTPQQIRDKLLEECLESGSSINKRNTYEEKGGEQDTLLQTLVEMLDTLIASFYSLMDTKIKREIPCSHCFFSLNFKTWDSDVVAFNYKSISREYVEKILFLSREFLLLSESPSISVFSLEECISNFIQSKGDVRFKWYKIISHSNLQFFVFLKS